MPPHALQNCYDLKTNQSTVCGTLTRVYITHTPGFLHAPYPTAQQPSPGSNAEKSHRYSSWDVHGSLIITARNHPDNPNVHQQGCYSRERNNLGSEG